MKKRVLATIMAAALAASAFTGCGSSSDSSSAGETASSAAEESAAEAGSETAAAESDFEVKDYSIAIPLPETGITAFEIMRSNMDQIEALTGGECINALADLTPDGVISFVESQIAAGVSGLIIVPPSDSVIPTVTSLCEEAGVYWGISMRSISDPDIKALAEASPYYIGNCYEDEDTAGYTCGKWMGEAGYKKIAIISQAKGDTTCDTREVGLQRACDEYGIEIVAESRGHSQATDATQATESFLAANTDLDAIFIVGSAVTGEHEAVIKAIQDAGREEVSLVTIDFPSDMVTDFETGILKYAYGAVSLAFDPTVLLIKLVNAIQGTPVTTADGSEVTSNYMYMMGIDNAEAASEYMSVLDDPDYLFFTDEEVSNMFVWNNPDINEEAIQEIVDNYEVREN